MIHNLLLKTSSVFFSTLVIFTCTKKLPEPIVARGGNTTIPVSEFKDRFELTPHINHSSDVKRNKRNILISLLGEKLLVEDARSRDLDNNEKFLVFSEQIKNEAIVEKLIEQEISSKIEISTEEVKQGFVRSQVNLDLRVLTFDTEEQAFNAKKEIDSGKALVQVKREYQTDTFISADSVITIQMKWGEAHPSLEEVAYSLKMNEVAEPVFADGKYYILKLVNRSSVVFLTEGEFINKAPSIRKKIKGRKRAEMYAQYMQALMADKQVRVSHEDFDQVATALERIYGIEDNSSSSNEKIPEVSTDSLRKSSDIVDHLNDTFALFDDGSIWTIGDFIKKLGVGPYPLNKKSKVSFRNSLRSIVRKMTELETLAKKGREENLHKSNYVQYQTKMWQDSYLGQLVRKQIVDTVTVSDEEIKYYYKKHGKNYARPAMIKLHEILVDDLSLAKQIFQRIKNGASMFALARQYNQREVSIKTNGVMGYFKPTSLGRIGEVANKLNKGEIAGPIKTEKNQYSVFKLLEKIDAGPMPIEETWEDVKRDALSEKKLRAVDNVLIQLADKYNVKLNKSVIDTMQMNDINMLIIKQHYAGRTAAPTITPLQNSPRWQNYMDKIYPIGK
jgi:peptidyl-prolyl cis-trans isomerase C